MCKKIIITLCTVAKARSWAVAEGAVGSYDGRCHVSGGCYLSGLSVMQTAMTEQQQLPCWALHNEHTRSKAVGTFSILMFYTIHTIYISRSLLQRRASIALSAQARPGPAPVPATATRCSAYCLGCTASGVTVWRGHTIAIPLPYHFTRTVGLRSRTEHR